MTSLISSVAMQLTKKQRLSGSQQLCGSKPHSSCKCVIETCWFFCAGMTGYVLKATLSSTMGRAVPVTLPSLQQAISAYQSKR